MAFLDIYFRAAIAESQWLLTTTPGMYPSFISKRTMMSGKYVAGH